MGKQLYLCFAVLKFGRNELLVFALPWTAKRLSVLTLLWLVLLCISRVYLIPYRLPFLELTFCLLGLGYSRTLDFHAHLFQSLTGKLHNMEAVNDNLCVGEYLFGDSHHAVGEVHCHLLDSKAAFLGELGKTFSYIVDSRTLGCGDKSPMFSMSVLVRKKSELVIMQKALVYAQTRSHVLRQQHVLTSMVFLVPILEITQVFFIYTLEVFAVSLEESPHATGRYWVSIQPLL